MKEILREMFQGLARWPLLLGALVAWALALYEEMVTDTTEILIAVSGMVVGSFLLGAWLVSYIIDGERRWNRNKATHIEIDESKEE